MKASVPDRWRDYPCEDYFAEGWWRQGHFDESSQTLVIAPLNEAYENAEFDFFAVGRSGADGIDFGYRKGKSGLWAFYPIECDFKYMAGTTSELAREWCAGRLSV